MRYIIRKFVEAQSEEEARKKAEKTPIHEVYIDDRVWEKQGYSFTEEPVPIKGFDKNDRGQHKKVN